MMNLLTHSVVALSLPHRRVTPIFRWPQSSRTGWILTASVDDDSTAYPSMRYRRHSLSVAYSKSHGILGINFRLSVEPVLRIMPRFKAAHLRHRIRGFCDAVVPYCNHLLMGFLRPVLSAQADHPEKGSFMNLISCDARTRADYRLTAE